MTRFLDIAYGAEKLGAFPSVTEFVTTTFPPGAWAAILLLPTAYLSQKPLYNLLEGFKTDLKFSSKGNSFPIKDLPTLRLYASRVAGTVAESCIELVYHHTSAPTLDPLRRQIIEAGGLMGVALQYVNISRDIKVDAGLGRVYIPTQWLKEQGLKPEAVIKEPESPRVEVVRQKLLDNAMDMYLEARKAVEQLPPEARGPMRVTVESYMEIGRVLRTPGYKTKAGRATVPKLRRIRVAWNALGR